jgi:hypothetical protein
MNKQDLQGWIGAGANLGVIAGIIFLGLELQQNNALLMAQARWSRTESRQANQRLVIENPDLLRVISKNFSKEELTEDETRLLSLYFTYSFGGMQYSWEEYQAGLIGLDSIPVEGYRRNFATFPGLVEYWENNKYSYSPEFVRRIEDEVVGSD